MAETIFPTSLQLKQWQSTFTKEYVRKNLFNQYMGTDPNKVIQLVKDLTKKRGDTIVVQFVNRLHGGVITGDNTLKGNEDSLDMAGDEIEVDQWRKAVSRAQMEQQRGNIDILPAGRQALLDFAMEYTRDEIIEKMMSPNLDGKTSYDASTEAQKDAWLAANGLDAELVTGKSATRVQFGASLDNNAANVHSTCLAEVDSTTDIFQPDILDVALRQIKQTTPNIRPIKVVNEREMYVAFTGPWAHRDFKTHTDYRTTAREAEVRGKENPLWKAGDLLWNDCIVAEIPQIPVIAGVGNGGIDVQPVFICGTQAAAIAWARMTRLVRDDDDYKNIEGVGVAEIRGVKKMFFDDIQYGMYTLYVAGVADT